MANPLLDDRDVDFLLYDVHHVDRLCALPYFEEHSRETFDLFLGSVRRLAREVLFPAYKPMDEAPPTFSGGRVRVHAEMHRIYPRVVELGLISAARPHEVFGMQLPTSIFMTAQAYLGAANLSACGFLFLTTGAAHLVETFGNEALRRSYMEPMYSGAWTGTMALTEPQAGSSLADVTTTATPHEDGSHRIKGSKIFISGGDHDLTPNVVNLVLARIDGAPPGTKGVSLFVVPRMREEGGALVDNDVTTAGVIHKIGWRGLPSVILELGDRGDCHGFLLGEPNKGLSYMFQMMNEARVSVGMSAVATASVAYQESLAYARDRRQGRPLGVRDVRAPQVPIVEHADVRRMLLRQKAIVEGALSLAIATSMYSDLAAHGRDDVEKKRAQRLLDLLTPITKSFPAEKGFESNALAVQILGGYGYSSEYLPEAWLRDQKLNSIHEGTTGIQSLDLLGRKAMAEGGASLQALIEEIDAAIARARAAGADESWSVALRTAIDRIAALTMQLGALGLSGDADRMLRHSADYLEAMSIVVVAWQWLLQASAAKEAIARTGSTPHLEGKLCAAQYWIATELPRVEAIVALCASEEDSYARMRPEWF